MPSTKLLIFLAFWLSFSSALNNETKSPQGTYSDGSSKTVPAGCADCSICPYLCQVQAQPPPPPPPLTQVPPAQANCPPPPPGPGDQVGCCQTAPTMPYFFNPGNNVSVPVSLEHKIKHSTATWLSAAFIVFITIMVRD